jgi:hypothetical protein
MGLCVAHNVSQPAKADMRNNDASAENKQCQPSIAGFAETLAARRSASSRLAGTGGALQLKQISCTWRLS